MKGIDPAALTSGDALLAAAKAIDAYVPLTAGNYLVAGEAFKDALAAAALAAQGTGGGDARRVPSPPPPPVAGAENIGRPTPVRATVRIVGVFADDGTLRRIVDGEVELSALAYDERVRVIPHDEILRRWAVSEPASSSTQEGPDESPRAYCPDCNIDSDGTPLYPDGEGAPDCRGCNGTGWAQPSPEGGEHAADDA